MNKRISALIVSLFILSAMLFVPASAESLSPITYDGERIKIEATLEGAENTPVTIIVGKPLTTLEQVKGASTQAQLLPLVEYIGVHTLTNNATNLDATIELRSELSTGTCEVYIAYLNTPLYKLGDFENLSRQDINNMVDAFNDTALASYETLFTDSNKMYLRAFNADVTGYESLSTQKSNFYSYLVSKKRFEATDDETAVGVLVKHFNAGIAFAKLSDATTSDAAFAIASDESYNAKYWNLAIGEGTVFDGLGETEKTRIFDVIADGTYYDAATLESNFATQLAISVFLECSNAIDVENALSEYQSVYQLDETLMDDSRFADNYEYYETLVYNKMIEYKSTVSDVSTLQALYARAVGDILDGIPADDDEDDEERYYGSTGGGGGGGVIIKKDDVQKPSEDLVPVTTPTFFRDVPESHWAYENIKTLFDKKIVSGKSTEQFAPNDFVTREEYAKMMVLALDSAITDTAVSYSDVKAGSWYQPYIATAVRDGLLNGLGDGTVGIGNALTREDAAVMIERALKSKGITLEEGDAEFSDGAEISDYAKAAVSRLIQSGVINGYADNTFMPKKTISRAEVCTMIVRMLELLEGEGK